MSHRLTKAEMQEYLDTIHLEVGEQHHVNHANCPEGADTKARLYIKRVSSGHLFFCQHCKGTGIVRAEGMPYGLHTGELRLKTGEYVEYGRAMSTYTPDLDFGGIRNVQDWPLEAKLWWYSYGLTDEDAAAYGVWYRPSVSRLFLPINGKRAAARFIYSPSTHTAKIGIYNAKYLEFSAKNKAPQLLLTSPDKPLFIVEDVVSAYKLHKAGANVLPLFGTSITDAEIAEVSKFPIVVVWLDEDTAGITASTEVYNKVRSFTPAYTICLHQPKECSDYDLKRFVETYYTLSISSKGTK